MELYSFDLQFLRRLFKLITYLFQRKVVHFLFLFLLFLALVEEFVVYRVGLITSEYYKTLGEKNWAGFWLHTVKAVSLIFAISFVKSSREYTASVLYVSWRQLLTQELQKLYFAGFNYYKINVVNCHLDNPDQRITQDVEKMCKALSTAIPTIIVSPFTIAYYSYTSYETSGIIGPGAILLFFVIGTVINKFLMSPVVNKVFLQEKYEGFFRFKHMHLRTYAESVAFQDAGHTELSHTSHKLASLVEVQQQLFIKQYPLSLSVNLFNYLGSIISFMVLAVPLFAGKYDSLSGPDLSALISKNVFVSIYLISCFSQLVDLSTVFTTIAGTTHRIGELHEYLTMLNERQNEVSHLKANSELDSDDGETLFQLSEVSYMPPNGNTPLVEGLTFSVVKGTNIVVMGASSSGKTSLLRVLKNLWPISGGSLQRRITFTPSQVLFLPQKPVMTDGSLYQQIIFPLEEAILYQSSLERKQEVERYLSLTDLNHILDRAKGLDTTVEWNWEDVLSPGEMQRLSFVRLFYHCPQLAVLDEATSAVGQEMEEVLYRQCSNLGITLLSVGHRQTLTKYHDKILWFDGKGGWQFRNLQPNKMGDTVPGVST
ncbi:ATP-binding cassette sub-family D member 4-like [Limulus polyphemus]|uniref:ATP-binding cassette sub-family D member 4-like n=1 Tax=Limulus polyphemus TaxID=6850 RepID=A0ABM1B1N1_LIMPO|nr:ATP-binding cassette sub-family D member 4-like [Limulus polyphemus]